MTHSITIPSLDKLSDAATEFAALIGENTIFAFYGSMGAGKTTFIKALCGVLGSADTANSPSFSIVNEYADLHGNPIYHFDCYRFNSPAEALDIGIEEYLYSGNLCLIEWPERIEPLLPDDTVTVEITENDDASRTITITTPF